MPDETPRTDDPATPAESAAAPPPPAPGDGPDEERASGGMRAFAVVFALVLAFAAAVMIIVAVDVGDTLICDEANSLSQQERAAQDVTECFPGSDAHKVVNVGLAYASGALGALAALLALLYAATARHGRRLMQLATAAIVVGALSILVGSI